MSSSDLNIQVWEVEQILRESWVYSEYQFRVALEVNEIYVLNFHLFKYVYT